MWSSLKKVTSTFIGKKLLRQATNENDMFELITTAGDLQPLLNSIYLCYADVKPASMFIICLRSTL